MSSPSAPRRDARISSASSRKDHHHQPNQDKTAKPRPEHNPRERRREKKKKTHTGAGAMPRCISGARRTDRGRRARPGGREHKGKPKPQTGFGFPQRLRKRKTETKTSPANIPTKRKEREDNKHQSEQGAGLKGHQTKQHFNPEDHETHTKNIQIPKEHQTSKTNTKHTESQGNCHSRVAGPMGRPALLGSRPRGPQYRGVQVPPHCGNRPRWRKNKHRPRQGTTTPKDIDPALSRPLMPSHNQTRR